MLDFLEVRRPVSTWGQGSLRDRISLIHADTIAIIVAILGVGFALWRAIASIRQDITALRQEVRADIAALTSRIDTLDARFTSRIDALYQSLFSHKDPAA